MFCPGAKRLALLSPEIFLACPGGSGFDAGRDAAVVLTVVVQADRLTIVTAIKAETANLERVFFFMFWVLSLYSKSTIKIGVNVLA